MAALIRAGVSKREKPSIIDKNNYSYVGNGGTETTIYWRCSSRLVEGFETTPKAGVLSINCL